MSVSFYVSWNAETEKLTLRDAKNVPLATDSVVDLSTESSTAHGIRFGLTPIISDSGNIRINAELSMCESILPSQPLFNNIEFSDEPTTESGALVSSIQKDYYVSNMYNNRIEVTATSKYSNGTIYWTETYIFYFENEIYFLPDSVDVSFSYDITTPEIAWITSSTSGGGNITVWAGGTYTAENIDTGETIPLESDINDGILWNIPSTARGYNWRIQVVRTGRSVYDANAFSVTGYSDIVFIPHIHNKLAVSTGDSIIFGECYVSDGTQLRYAKEIYVSDGEKWNIASYKE